MPIAKHLDGIVKCKEGEKNFSMHDLSQHSKIKYDNNIIP